MHNAFEFIPQFSRAELRPSPSPSSTSYRHIWYPAGPTQISRTMQCDLTLLIGLDIVAGQGFIEHFPGILHTIVSQAHASNGTLSRPQQEMHMIVEACCLPLRF
ncbi:hypothetical protein Vi05172_g10412 [Venturia inaequalis]|nr:hypothetical protein Vi05172_g10412 [Venturia inaequalis]